MQLDLYTPTLTGSGERAADLEQEMNTEQLRYLFGPIAHQSRQWHDTVPDWLIQAVPTARAEVIRKEIAGERAALASDEEVVIVLYGASLDAPIPPEYVDIQVGLVCRLMQKHRRVDITDAFSGAGCVLRRVDDNDRLLMDLKRRIRAAVVRKSNYKSHGTKKKNEN